MELMIFRTLWGVDEPIDAAVARAAKHGFDGIESPVPSTPEEARRLQAALERHGLAWIAEICTGGNYVPRRDLDPAGHLQELEQGLEACAGLVPVRINCLGGLDAWDEATSRAFLEQGMEAAQRLNLPLCFETHRSRSLFNPWVTRRLAEALPELRLTADISHWCVVAERLMDSETDTLEAIAPNVRHIHARVGYDQGPQVPHPAAPEYKHCLDSHQRFWELFWGAQARAGVAPLTLTPEFGPDGYLHHLPFTNVPVADLFQINRWMADTERRHFAKWSERSWEKSGAV